MASPAAPCRSTPGGTGNRPGPTWEPFPNVDYEQGRGYVWVCDRAATEIWPEEGNVKRHESVELILTEFHDGDYDVEYWNTLTGEIIHRETRTAAGDSLVLALPPFEISLAAKIKPTTPRDARKEE